MTLRPSWANLGYRVDFVEKKVQSRGKGKGSYTDPL